MTDTKQLLKEIDESNFKDAIARQDRVVVIDFWATWCSPCKALTPVLERLAQEFEEKADFYKLNIDENPSIPTDYGIRSIPTLLFFREGKVLDQITGNLPIDYIRNTLNRLIDGR